MSVAWLFPGQGSQSVGMGADVARTFDSARDTFDAADRALGEQLSRLIAEGPEETLTLTENAQPALVATSIAVLSALHEQAPDLPPPAFAAGHSLGEYSALVAAGALKLEDAVRIVRARGAAMQRAVPAGTGAMSAVMGVEPDRLIELCQQAAAGEVISPANFNGPGQIVVAGHAGAVARLGELVAAAKGRAIPLKVSAPFHCALMAPAALAVKDALAKAPPSPLRFPVVANFDAQPNTDPSRAAELLVKQVDGPVRWEESVRRMASEGVTHALEIGPGQVLAKLVKRIAKEIKVLSVSDAAGVREAIDFVKAAS